MSMALALCLVVAATSPAAAPTKPEDLPPPTVVDPGKPGAAPADAIVLFDGRNLDEWTGPTGPLEGWKLERRELVLVARHEHAEKTGTWDLVSKRTFSDAQIHLEFKLPAMKGAKGQARANSGLILPGRYEVQILDSFDNPTYPMGTAGALYAHSPPLVNAARRPGEWQTYDLVFHAPKCAPDGTLVEPGSLTLLHNGVLVQDHARFKPRSGCDAAPGPVRLQDHYHPDVQVTPLRVRSFWVRPLPSAP